jgi:hypothetical protein
MTDGIDPAIIAAAAAAEEEQEVGALLEEEEEMAHYTPEDLEGDWEFKIVRSSAAAFGNPKAFARLLEEEAHFGWVMLEKLDDSRVRFKRRRGRLQGPAGVESGGDPYRTEYGLSMAMRRRLMVILLGLVIIALIVMFQSGAR